MTRFPLLAMVCAAVACTEEGWRPTHAPLDIVITSADMTDAQLSAITTAADRWHDELGREVLRIHVGPDAATQCGRADLTFDPMPGMANGTTIRRGCRASIVVQSDLSPHYMSIVAAHELGHALGLDHERDHDSLMNASAPFDGGFISEAQHDYVLSLFD